MLKLHMTISLAQTASSLSWQIETSDYQMSCFSSSKRQKANLRPSIESVLARSNDRYHANSSMCVSCILFILHALIAALFLFLFVSGIDCGLWFWHCLGCSVNFFMSFIIVAMTFATFPFVRHLVFALSNIAWLSELSWGKAIIWAFRLYLAMLDVICVVCAPLPFNVFGFTCTNY